MNISLYKYLTDSQNHITLSQEAFLKHYKYTYLFIYHKDPSNIVYYGTNELMEGINNKYYIINEDINYPGSKLASKIIKNIEEYKNVGKSFYLPMVDKPEKGVITIRHRVKGYKLINEN